MEMLLKKIYGSQLQSYSKIKVSLPMYLTEEKEFYEATIFDVKFIIVKNKSIARNEILARHGRRFKDNELQAYFDSKPWYTGYIEANDFNENILNEYESANMYFIKAFENDYDKYH